MSLERPFWHQITDSGSVANGTASVTHDRAFSRSVSVEPSSNLSNLCRQERLLWEHDLRFKICVARAAVLTRDLVPDLCRWDGRLNRERLHKHEPTSMFPLSENSNTISMFGMRSIPKSKWFSMFWRGCPIPKSRLSLLWAFRPDF